MSDTLQKTFEDVRLFEEWDRRYYYPEAIHFYAMAFDFIEKALGVKPGARVLDAGCGPGRHSMHFARKGIRCLAMDFSESVLQEAQKRVAAAGLEKMIEFKREDLTCLTFPDGTFEHIFCWGVLMHVPDVEKAVQELARVLKPGGRIAIGLTSPRSLEEMTFSLLRRLRPAKRTSNGEEPHWVPSVGGPIYVKGIAPHAMSRLLVEKGLCVREQRAGQFTEYRAASGVLRKAVSAFNEVWFKFVRSPILCGGYILIAEKPMR